MTPVLPDADPDDQALGRRAARALAELPDAPSSWIAAAIAQWPAVPVREPMVLGTLLGAWLAGLRRVLATLRFDSAAQPVLALGMRGGRAGTRQLLFSAEGYDLDLRLTPDLSGPCWQLDGQVLGPEGPMRVSLTTGEAVADSLAGRGDQAGPGPAPAPAGPGSAAGLATEVDELGEFHFQGLEGGRWRLQLQLPQLLVDLPPIELDARPGAPGGSG